MSPRVASLALLALGVSCGSRTGLLSGEGASGSSGSSGSSSSSGSVGFDAGCAQPLWLLFDIVDNSSKMTAIGIYAMRADGTQGHMLNLPNQPAHFPSVSPDGSKLLYASGSPAGSGGDSTLFIDDLASGSSSPVVNTVGLTYSALSPDGRTVSYVSLYTLRAIDADGSNDRALLVGPSNGTGYGHPVFESDSHTVVYGTGGIIGAIGSDGTNNRTLLQTGSSQYPNPAFSPDYQQIVVGVTCDLSLPSTLSVYPFASLPGAPCSSGRVLTDVRDGSSSNLANDPSWGANGLIAYASGPDVFVIDPTGGGPTNMTASLTGDAGLVTVADPVWAPACAPIP